MTQRLHRVRLMTVKIFFYFLLYHIHTVLYTKVEKLNPFLAFFWPRTGALSTFPIKEPHPHTHTTTTTAKNLQILLIHAQFQRRDRRWCVTRQHLKVPWQSQRVSPCPSRSDLSLVLLNGSFRHILPLYFLLAISQPTEVPFLFLF